jgi:hypothetical protein
MITVTKHTITKDDVGRVCLFPNHKTAYEKVQRMREGRNIVIEIKTKINPRYFRLLWGLARCLSVHSGEDSYFSNKNEYVIMKTLQLDAGDTTPIMDLRTGEIIQVPKSLSYTEKQINENYEAIEKKLFEVVADVLKVDEIQLRKNYQELL